MGVCVRCGKPGGIWPGLLNLNLCRRCRGDWEESSHKGYVGRIVSAWLTTDPTDPKPIPEVPHDE